MEIRKTRPGDLVRVMEIYEYARGFMKESGNPNQWKDSFPPQEMIERDIKTGQSYVVQSGEELLGVFAFIIGEDPSYKVIEQGGWKNEEPYGTIHRIAGAGKGKGVFACCMDFCKRQMDNLRIDTHHDNKIMQHLIEKHGFEKCGIIHVEDGSARIAYQWTK